MIPDIFYHFLKKTYIVTPYKNSLGETVLIRSHNMFYMEEYEKQDLSQGHDSSPDSALPIT